MSPPQHSSVAAGHVGKETQICLKPRLGKISAARHAQKVWIQWSVPAHHALLKFGFEKFYKNVPKKVRLKENIWWLPLPQHPCWRAANFHIVANQILAAPDVATKVCASFGSNKPKTIKISWNERSLERICQQQVKKTAADISGPVSPAIVSSPCLPMNAHLENHVPFGDARTSSLVEGIRATTLVRSSYRPEGSALSHVAVSYSWQTASAPTFFRQFTRYGPIYNIAEGSTRRSKFKFWNIHECECGVSVGWRRSCVYVSHDYHVNMCHMRFFTCT